MSPPEDAVPRATIVELVGGRWPGAEVTALQHVAGDFSARRYLRASLHGGGAPATTVVMVLAGTGLPLSSEELAIFPEPPRELPFLDVQRLLQAIGAPVPEIYVDAVDRGILLLEDGGDAVLWDRIVAEPAGAEAWFRRAIDTLVLVHERGTAHADRSSIAFAQHFDARLAAWELEHFAEYGIERRLERRLTAAERAGLDESFRAIATTFAESPMVLSHRDFHCWNILVRDGAPFLIDFQDALLAAPEYDVASLLTDRITPRVVNGAMEERLLRYYWERRRDPDACDPHRYRVVALHRVLKVIGRLHYLAIEKAKPGPLAFLPDVLTTTRRLLAQTELPGGLHETFAALPWPETADA